MTVSTPPIRPTPRAASAGLSHESLYKDIVGASPSMRRIFRLVSKVAPTDSTVLILGESGTGKELVARSIHLQSRRAQSPFVPVNVGAIPDALVESELFGYARGAFTGAAAERRGLLEEADGGTLFLDEIGDMPADTQVKLLRTLETGEVRRLGDNATRVVDIRVVAATNHDLQAELAAGRFRDDLYYRLNVVQLDLPPLRERREDIGLLASYFLERVARGQGRKGLHFAPDAMDVLERADYPGNVRELLNAIEHAVTLAEGPAIHVADLPAALRAPRMLPQPRASASALTEAATATEAAATGPSGDPVTWSLPEVEKDHIRRVLARHHGNATAAAKQLGISRTTLWRKLRLYRLRREG